MPEIGHKFSFVDRGDPSAADFTQATLTTDGAWHDLDLSSIVPAGAKAVTFRISIYDDETGSYLLFRKNGNSNAVNESVIRTEVADLWTDRDLIVALDENRKIEYLGIARVIAGITFVVKGWWV